MKENLIVIGGATASGKTSLSVDLAKELRGEIISGDSVQVYKHMDIGSAKVTKEEMGGIPHYLVDEFYPDEEFNVSVFLEKGKHYIDVINSKNKTPILVGGSGLYIDSLVYNSYDFGKSSGIDLEYRNYLIETLEKTSNEHLHNMLNEVDPISATEIHKNNVKRVMRALEIYHTSKVPKSEIEYKKKEYRYKNTYYFVIDYNREELYERIDKRVDIMSENGLVNEVSSLLSRGYKEDLVSMQSLGYKQIIMYLKGEISLEEAVYIIKRDTRHFAKRQMTWFRRNKDIIFIDKEKYQSNEEMIGFIRSKICIKE